MCYEEEFEKYLKILISVYFAIFVVINFALWISEQAQFKNFGSMLATICFFTFVVSLFHMKIERDQYRKNLELEYKEFSEQQMSRYMAEIQSLYSIVRGFRHDLGNLVISMSLAIEEKNISEIQRIHREVLEEGYKKINTEELSGFNLVNIRDSALRSILIRGWLDARDAGVEMTFETSEPIEQLPVDLLDIVRIVGILVTNALEASKEAEEKTAAVRKYLLDEKTGLFVSGEEKQINYASQVWLILAGAVSIEEGSAMLDKLDELKPEKGMVSPYMNHHYVEALLMCGKKDQAMEYMKYYWGGMISHGADTFWELYNPENPAESPYGSSIVNSYCHAWSCTLTYLLRKYFN